MESFENWTVQVRKGLLELAVLNALSSGERYGYELVRALVSVPGLSVAEGTVYPLLSRLRLQGLLRTRVEESVEGPPRKYYALTPQGRKACSMMNAYLQSLIGGCAALRGKEETDGPVD